MRGRARHHEHQGRRPRYSRVARLHASSPCLRQKDTMTRDVAGSSQTLLNRYRTMGTSDEQRKVTRASFKLIRRHTAGVRMLQVDAESEVHERGEARRMPQGGKGRRTPRHRRTLRLGGSRRPRRVAHGSRKSESDSQWALQHDHHGGSVWIPIQRSACNLRRGVATGSRRAPLARQRTGLPGVGTPSYHT